MIKKFSACLLFLLSFAAFAQQGTSSPYSFYGIGDIRFRGTNETRAMGGLSFVSDSIHINMQNPALLSDLKLTTFAVGGTFSPVVLRTDSQKEKAQRTTLDYLAVALPAKSFTIGFGLIPFSSVGYSVRNTIDINGDGTLYRYDRFRGEGGINRVYGAVSYKINSKLSIGAEVNFNFGSIETKKVTYQDDVQLGTREINTSNVDGLGINAGISYHTKLNKKMDFFSGLTLSPQTNLSVRNQREINTVQVFTDNEVDYGNPYQVPVASTKLRLPAKVSLGAGVGEMRKWFAGAELAFQNSSDFGNRFNDLTNVSYENGARINLGGYFIPQYNSFTQYWKRITYRGGFRFENTGLVVNNHGINDAAITAGFGFPVGKTFSNLNLGFEFGQRGTTNSGLVKENYINVNIGISFNDRWFIKRKYD